MKIDFNKLVILILLALFILTATLGITMSFYGRNELFFGRVIGEWHEDISRLLVVFALVHVYMKRELILEHFKIGSK